MFLSVLLLVLGNDGGITDAGAKLGPCRDRQALCFSPVDRCHEVIIGVIDRAINQLDIAIYAINQPDIVSAIIRAAQRGVRVRMVLDSMQLGQAKQQEQLKRLIPYKIPMKRDNHSGIMHLKTVIADQKEFVTGSFNFTNNATSNNNENLLAWECPRNALLFQVDFDRLWASFKDVVLDAGLP